MVFIYNTLSYRRVATRAIGQDNTAKFFATQNCCSSLYSIFTRKMVFVYTGKGRRGAQKDDAPPEQKLCAKQG